MTEHYAYCVRWSAEDGEYLATVAELPSLSWLSPSPEQAFAGPRTLVANVVTDMAHSGEEPPAPLAERSLGTVRRAGSERVAPPSVAA